jgi:hypothetical protein
MLAQAPNTSLLLFLLLSCTFFLLSCSENETTQEEDFAKLQKMYVELESFAHSLPCEDATEWRYAPIGAKPCGGPWSYMAYHSSINTKTFITKVDEYYRFNDHLNRKWGLGSDCMYVFPPSEITCNDAKPVLVY